MASDIGYRLLRLGTGAFVRIDSTVTRASSASRAALGSLLSAALAPAELEELSIWLYDRVPRRYVAKELWSWERQWLANRLPPPPARILIGAAGSGREAIALAAQGYEVHAFDPAAKMTALAAAALGEPHRVAAGSFADLVAAVFDLEDNALSSMASERYDAVLLGWGSLSHVLSAAAREHLIAATDTLAPEGPILASFFLRVEAPVSGRAKRLGRALGKRIARARGLAEPAEPVDFSTNLGFTYVFEKDELEALAKGCGRTLVWEPEPGFPHATFAR